MKPTLLYTYVAKPTHDAACPAEQYDAWAKRFVESYVANPPGCEHDTVIVLCGDMQGDAVAGVADLFKPLPELRFVSYSGNGKDIGAYQSALKDHHGWVLCCNSGSYFRKPGWLQRFVEAATKHGDGLYASQASYEVSPHLRSPCWFMPAFLMRDYPHKIITAPEVNKAECGDWNFSRWVMKRGNPCKLVTWGGEYDISEWRTPPNIFRRGDQSNILVYDRHNDLYDEADEATKKKTADDADGRSSVSTAIAIQHAGHLRTESFCKLIDMVKNRRGMHIVETGTHRGTYGDGMSTLILATLAEQTHSYFASVEINPGVIEVSKAMMKKHGGPPVDYICGDSVSVLSMFPNNKQVVVLYLDSYDYEVGNPLPAQMHQLAELGAVYGKLSADAVILLDDCNMEGGGKGLLTDQFLKARGWRLVHDGYQKLFSRV